ncbi:LysR family transcriptional regulator [Aestuariivirga sp. YIM B02566]|jgi:LysR family transcriptional regulator, regulator for bpeEF and oprC|uniref:LysR family transcriptional regulator n=1 Tax=Taklimakanibacter albus TaxID=2800327 RepID=A0ACC5R490_9HYPH|nr:LysR family transcriptional regulator [Aestuariivirga sp. YIM B02566]MBK1867188.1 LysR family transcriptional regulator [Aestuariivirga sp. YIM B02566]
MDRIDELKIFIRLAESQSFTRTADLLHMPRSTVSMALQDLEQRVGARLLQRTTRQVSLTEDGSAFYERALRLLADYEETETLFRQSTAKPGGKLRINVPGRLGRLIIAPALPDFFAAFPDIEIDMGVTDRTVDLVQEGIDCVIRVGPLADSTLVSRRIGDLVLLNCASPSYLERHGTPHVVTDLAGHVAVNYASPASGRTEEWEYAEAGKIHSLKLRSRVTVNNAEAYIACCLAGLGLIQIPAYDVREHIEAGDLVEVMSDLRAAPMPIALLYPHRQHASRRLQVFLDWVTALLMSRLF